MKFAWRVAIGITCLLPISQAVQADNFDALRSRADKHAPASLMGDHLHDPGEWMVEYKYMNMYMEDNRAGSRTLSDAESIAFGASSNPVTNRAATPTQMTHEMHMLHIMRGVTDDITVYTMLMLPSITMDHQRRMDGSSFTTHNSGFGDTTFGALLRLYSDVNDDLILNVAASVPTGDIFRTSTIPSRGATDQALPYPMRLGSGTFNAKPGITWKHYRDTGSFGLQFQTNLPVGRNYRDYAVSDEFRLNTWYSHLLSDNFSTSVRLENLWRTNYDGADPAANDMMISTNVEGFRGGYSLNLGIGFSALIKKHLLNVEFVPTLYQDLDGIQLETDWQVAASWSRSF
ncbi:hypothetical protein K227x_00530 [Rubripirellula lacrimiformis]|uniref:MetA-pathway of phenol degradation n=1 Tax=Rubripirellula lacrimiformis TaxID=1930273 RepID=A0A517N3H0_9BACT|nr:transporter [Rubripirellula lacrimiformis]QDT01686.1 hypothetical protein K227x_00530 [Rubripirellula lacrimiformis]